MVLEKNTYGSVLKMLNSVDKDDVKLAFDVIINAELNKNNLIYILFLYKESNLHSNDWKRYAEKVYNKLQSIFKQNNLTVINILNIFQIREIMTKYENDLSEEDYIFFVNKLFHDYFRRFDFKKIKNIEINIEFNGSN